MVTAFIPVRGGSKSIPLKNIKLFCGKPLVCWNIEALESCRDIDEIIVATDSPQIAEVVNSRGYEKTRIYWRSKESASDTASTESVMIEYINNEGMLPDDVFMLVQATSPLTESEHFTQALQMYFDGDYDSILTCVRNYRFFWNADGTSMNYDYTKRPRRQDFGGILMENGAFYINAVGNILKTGNRLSGNIGIYEMPDYTATEIDEPDDWAALENIMRRRILARNEGVHNIKLFLSDVDGTLTDAGMYYSEAGDEMKKFNTKDGLGFSLLKKAKIKTGIITSESTNMVSNRAKKLKLDYVYQGKANSKKLEAVKDICGKMGISLDNVAYIGDDLNCMEVLSNVGLAACPNDASDDVKNVPGIHIMKKNGGCGCVREFADMILSNHKEVC